MTNVRRIKRGDLWPALSYQVRYADATLDLADAITDETPVVFIIKARHSDTPLVDRAPGVVSTTGGSIVATYEWAPGDTDTPGEYRVNLEFDVDGRPATAPTSGHLVLIIEPDER